MTGRARARRGHVRNGQEADSDEHVVRRVRADRGPQPAGREVRGAEHRSGPDVLDRAAALPTDVPRGEQERADQERSGPADRRHEKPERDGTPHGLLVGRSDRQSKSAREEPGARNGRERRRRDPLAGKRREQDHSRADPERHCARAVIDQRVDLWRDRQGQSHRRGPPREPHDRHERLAPTGRR